MITLNQQKPESKAYYSDGSLDVIGRPWYTIQGEGPFAGRPAVFCRLAGCNLQCPACDTDYTSNRKRLSDYDLVTACYDASPKKTALADLFVITGGEPFRQNLGPFVRELLHYGCQVQIETNGTYFPDDEMFPLAAGNLTIVCSPKTPQVNDRLKPWIKALKYVLDAEHVDPNDGLPLTTLGNEVGVCKPWPGFEGEVFLQPKDEGGHPDENKDHTQAVVQSCLKYGYRCSLQMHKILGVP
jgi:organic radical activating enzyme